jgi:hypothetical protein
MTRNKIVASIIKTKEELGVFKPVTIIVPDVLMINLTVEPVYWYVTLPEIRVG